MLPVRRKVVKFLQMRRIEESLRTAGGDNQNTQGEQPI